MDCISSICNEAGIDINENNNLRDYLERKSFIHFRESSWR